MEKEIIVKVSHVSKDYRIYKRDTDRLKEVFSLKGKTYHKIFNALTDVSLELRRGESLGLIGRNGAGKSTLLKIIAGLSDATQGQVSIRGSLAAILELTSNLKSELTGIENIKVNLQLRGFNNNNIEKKTDEIADFSELGEFLDRKVKMYSSGMKSRLGFAIAMSCDPDVLILDEVLAVGDFSFQTKCLEKINSMRERMAILFVSHSMSSIRQFCNKAIVFDSGTAVFEGKSEDAAAFYMKLENKKNKEELETKALKKKKASEFYGTLFNNKKKITDVSYKWNKENYIKNEKMIFEFSFKLNFKPHNLIIGIPIWDSLGNMVTSMSTDQDDSVTARFEDGSFYGNLSLKNIFSPGEYISILSIYDGAEALYRQLDNFTADVHKHRYFGHMTPEHNWTIEKK